MRFGQFEFLPGGSFLRSTDGSFLLRSSLTLALPTRSLADLAANAKRHGTFRRHVSTQSSLLDAKASLTFFVQRMEAKEQDFIGIGSTPFTSHPPGYSLQLNDAGIAWNNPLLSWSSVGVNADFLQPRVGASSNTANPQVRDVFTEASAPGLTAHTDFLSIQPYLKIQVPPYRSTNVSLDVGYAFYHSFNDSNRYSFRRLSAAARLVHPFSLTANRHSVFQAVTQPEQKVKPSPMSVGRWIREAVCSSQRGAHRCTLGDISVFARVDYAFNSATSTVPFYLQSTLGGADFQGQDTLRGYADYRFRAPNRMFSQLEYRHPLWGPIGLLGFYDVGKVGLVRSDLSIDHLRHDWGIGLFARIGGREIARIYLGFGTGEGTQLHPRMGNVF
jgi:hypothetical protein